MMEHNTRTVLFEKNCTLTAYSCPSKVPMKLWNTILEEYKKRYFNNIPLYEFIANDVLTPLLKSKLHHISILMFHPHNLETIRKIRFDNNMAFTYFTHTSNYFALKCSPLDNEESFAYLICAIWNSKHKWKL